MKSVKTYFLGIRPKGSNAAYARVGRHAKDGRFIYWARPLGIVTRRRKLLRGTITAGELGTFHKWASKNGFESRALEANTTPLVSGAKDNIHAKLLSGINSFMAAHAPTKKANIISGFRSFAKQMALYLAFLAGKGNPANKPGSSKHEATGGYKVARAVDLYIEGVAFWTWVDRNGLRKQAEARGLTQPYSHEPWHVELKGL